VKVQRGPEAMSQRLPVSEDQKNYALQKAKKYKSKYPTTLEIMKDTNAYKTFFMVLFLSPCILLLISSLELLLFFSCKNVHDL
jgi:hypothetical protein